MPKLLFITKHEFCFFEKENEYLQITAILVVHTGFGDDTFYEEGYGLWLW